MSITINPNLPVVAVQGASANVVLQPGTVIKAQVLQILGNDEAQISIGGQTVQVATQVPLQAGETLQLSVSQAADGTIQLAIVTPQVNAVAAQAIAGLAAGATPSDVVTLAGALANIAAQATPATVVAQNQLSALEQIVVSSAAQTAATQQTSLAPLFANLSVAAGVTGLSPQVQQAVSQVLVQRINLSPSLSGDDIKQAFQSSGLFMEASLAAGSAAGSATPDLKAALMVLRQVLTTALSSTTETSVLPSATTTVVPQTVTATTVPQAAPTGQATTEAVVPAEPDVQIVPAGIQASPQTSSPASSPAMVVIAEPEGTATAAAATAPATVIAEPIPSPLAAAPTPAPPLAPEIVVTEGSPSGETSSLPQVVLELTAPAAATSAAATSAAAASADTTARAAASGAMLNLLQEAVQAGPLIAANPLGLAASDSAMLSLLPVLAGARMAGADETELVRSNVPPPPLGGALPAAQPVMPATLVKNASPETVMHQLLSDSDGAIARQTLLQVASLPHQVDSSAAKLDPTVPRWNFEIPFATPQGTTAMAQFEISRDGASNENEAAKRVWRARFSLNVEPAGPVHALISLSGARTSVRMWAERAATADQLRAGVSQLSQALARAELQPGDIIVRDGAPAPPVAARAGHFLDRAS
jgi:Flagellar hook-length control protein FliK